MCWCVWKIYEENRGSKIPSLTIITTPKPVTSKLNHFLFACESFLCVCSGGVGKKEQSSESLAYFLSSCLEAPTQHRFEEREGRKRAKVQFSSVSLFFLLQKVPFSELLLLSNIFSLSSFPTECSLVFIIFNKNMH